MRPPPHPMPAHCRLSVICFLLTTAGLLAACARPPTGPAFAPAASPPEHRARLYLYRADGRSSYSQVRITVDDREIGRFRDAEYETLEISAGTHQLRAGLRSLGWAAWGWNEQAIRMKPGETVFVEISVRLTQHEIPGGRDLDIAGRTRGGASENVYLQRRPEKEALERMTTTTRLAP